MKKILITGGSGFIGTNLINKIKGDFDIVNIDICEPKIKEHKKYWKNVDITNLENFQQVVVEFNPEIVIHLAARTDLNGRTIKDYDTNIKGVENLLNVLDNCKNLKRVLFASSMYVNEPGYKPKSFDDYNPHTIYGESKVETEKIIKKHNSLNYEWAILRPTSIWGPWFGEPYANFFNIVLSKKYFHLGKRACSKTYGFIDNTVFQILSLINADSKKIQGKVYYLGDWPSYNISEWADEIAAYANIKIYAIPFLFFRFLGWLGDVFNLFGFKFPMTSFRLKNMTTNNVHDLSLIQEITPHLPITRTQGVKITVDWIKSKK